jgi:hypothetical protein
MTPSQSYPENSDNESICSVCGCRFIPTLKRWKTRCPDCVRKYKREWFREKYRLGLVKQWRPTLERQREWIREYTARPEVRKQKAANMAKYRATPEYKQRFFARAQVKNAIKSGLLIKHPCEVCGDVAQAHHDNYDKPLDVRWLCLDHHREFHKKLKNETRIQQFRER